MTTLEKIKEEIKKIVDFAAVNSGIYVREYDVIQIIDKYAEQEPCDDAVSRILKRMWNCRGKHTTSIDKVKMEQIIRDELPSVRPQEQTGHWNEIVKEHKCYARDDTYTTTEYHCSECGAEPFVNEDGFYELSNYCPNCGCRMVEPRESEDKE